ncbi:MAG: hypothetical protein AAFZ92_00260, partial [Pseudomonadota bacterium]
LLAPIAIPQLLFAMGKVTYLPRLAARAMFSGVISTLMDMASAAFNRFMDFFNRAEAIQEDIETGGQLTAQQAELANNDLETLVTLSGQLAAGAVELVRSAWDAKQGGSSLDPAQLEELQTIADSHLRQAEDAARLAQEIKDKIPEQTSEDGVPEEKSEIDDDEEKSEFDHQLDDLDSTLGSASEAMDAYKRELSVDVDARSVFELSAEMMEEAFDQMSNATPDGSSSEDANTDIEGISVWSDADAAEKVAENLDSSLKSITTQKSLLAAHTWMFSLTWYNSDLAEVDQNGDPRPFRESGLDQIDWKPDIYKIYSSSYTQASLDFTWEGQSDVQAKWRNMFQGGFDNGYAFAFTDVGKAINGG